MTMASTWASATVSEPRAALAHGLCRVLLRAAVLCAGGLAAWPASAVNVYQTPEAFLAEVFAGDVPRPRRLWLTGELAQRVRAILGHAPRSLRVRYWWRDGRSAWILDEIGKEEPITTGIVVHRGRLERLKVLVFRETRGWEVRHPFFTDQFRGLGLTGDAELDGVVDNISGATLSVRALKRLARLALVLHAEAAKSRVRP